MPDFVADNPESVAAADECLKEVFEEFVKFVAIMEAVKIKEGIKQAMNISSICNKYMQKWEPWKASKTNPKFADSAINILMNVFMLLCSILEPFIPTFSAKVYTMINWKRGEKEETLLGQIYESKDYKKILSILPPKHTIDVPFPIFRESNIIFLIVSH